MLKETVSLEEVPEALVRLSERHVKGKIVDKREKDGALAGVILFYRVGNMGLPAVLQCLPADTTDLPAKMRILPARITH